MLGGLVAVAILAGAWASGAAHGRVTVTGPVTFRYVWLGAASHDTRSPSNHAMGPWSA
jgi:hypothetical protein